MMSELPDDAIGIYHRMFDFSGVRIPFSLFLLDLIKHYRVHFSQLGPLGLNKVFEHWKSGFFLIDWRAILDVMVWRHLDAAIDDPRPAAGSFSMVDVRRLSAYVIKLRDMPEGVLVLSGLSRVWKSHVCDSVLQGADGNGRPSKGFPFTALLLRSMLLSRILLWRIFPLVPLVPRFLLRLKLLRSESPLLLVPLRAMLPSVLGLPWLNRLIPFVTPLRSAAVIPSLGNRGRSYTAPAAKGPNTRDSRGKGIMADDAVALSVGVS
ncbi:hypothetical protein Tco_1307751 [Tanacetum coccineum]